MQNEHSQSNSTPSEPDYCVSGGTNTGEPWERFSVDQSVKYDRNGSGTKHLVFNTGHPSKYWPVNRACAPTTTPLELSSAYLAKTTQLFV